MPDLWRSHRRSHAFINPAICLLALLTLLLGACDRRPVPKQTGMQQMMGSYGAVSVYARDEFGARVAIQEALSAMNRVDELVSNYKPESELSRINRAAGEAFVEVDPTTLEVVREAVRMAHESDGAFDPTIGPLVRTWGFFQHEPRKPSDEDAGRYRTLVDFRRVRIDDDRMAVRLEAKGMSLDLGGIAKGYAVDLAAKALRARGIRSALANVSGSAFYAIGHPPDEAAWRVAIAHPREESAVIGTVLVRDAALATSSDGEQFFIRDGVRYGHIIDPRTGYPVSNGVVSVTVVAPTGTEADALATAVFVLGEEDGLALVKRHRGAECIIVRGNGDGRVSVTASEGLRDRFQPTRGSRAAP